MLIEQKLLANELKKRVEFGKTIFIRMNWSAFFSIEGNINSSLMVLRQCFETLRENQSQGTSKVRF